MCPSLRLVHVATWKAGDTKWSYRGDAADEIATSKACLDPYRIESKKILNIFRKHCEYVEKASIDESFLDLSEIVHKKLLEKFPEQLFGPAPYDDPTENLPFPPSELTLDWSNSTLIDLDEGSDEHARIDWDDVVMAVAGEIVATIRKDVCDELRYTCSAGISRNKMLSKLASGHKKPNNQTIIRTRAIGKFMSTMKISKSTNGHPRFAFCNTDTPTPQFVIWAASWGSKFQKRSGQRIYQPF